MTKTAQLDQEIAELVAASQRDEVDVTTELVAGCAGPGEYVKRVIDAKPASTLTPSMSRLLDDLRDPGEDLTIGYISNALAYGKTLRSSKSRHAGIIRLIKGGFVRVIKINKPPPPGTHAFAESRYSNQYYELRVTP